MSECYWIVLMAQTDIKARILPVFPNEKPSDMVWVEAIVSLRFKDEKKWILVTKTQIRKFSLAWCWPVNLVSYEGIDVSCLYETEWRWFTQWPKQARYYN